MAAILLAETPASSLAAHVICNDGSLGTGPPHVGLCAQVADAACDHVLLGEQADMLDGRKRGCGREVYQQGVVVARETDSDHSRYKQGVVVHENRQSDCTQSLKGVFLCLGDYA